jgi:hypothetical protein
MCQPPLWNPRHHVLPLRFWAQATHPLEWGCVCSFYLATAICCQVCSCVGRCAGAKRTANLVRAIVRLSAAQLSVELTVYALSELGWVSVYATDREKCCESATGTLTALETGCGMAS